MNLKALCAVSLVGLGVASCSAAAMAADDGAALPLVKNGAAGCKLIVITDKESAPLVHQATELVADTAKRWSGASLATADYNPAQPEEIADDAVVFATLGALEKLAPQGAPSRDELAPVAKLDEQGFAFVPVSREGMRRLFVVSQTPRGVYNGAVYLRDFSIDGDAKNLSVEFRPVARSPWMKGRTAYALTIWGNESKYTAQDWKTEFQGFARDGMDHVYFWVSGHFPSKQFPQAYKCKNVFEGKLYDTTEESRIGTVEDLREIVGSAHALGLKIYLGGALGGWCGTQFLTNLEPDTLKTGPKEPSLCPSNPKSHRALVDYYQELFAAVPDADGLFIESADEFGGCHCPLCSRAIDNLGSRQFGQSQLSICQEIMDGIWREHPQAGFAYTIGYREHTKDVAYYDLIQRMSKDPRIEWMEARNSWSFPGPGGALRPAPSFSPRVMHWGQYYNKPIEDMLVDSQRVKKDGWHGMIMSFEPGYNSGSFYREIPFPMDILPYALTGFVFRETTWDPDLTVDGMRERTQQRFFGHEAPAGLADDLWSLREIIRTKKGLDKVGAIESHIAAARGGANPKTTEGLDLMSRAATDIRKHFAQKQAK